MRWKGLSLFCLVLFCVCAFATNVSAYIDPGIQVSDNLSQINFPESITFRVSIKNSAEISRIVLEYRTIQLTCGSVISKGFPTFTPAKKVDVDWTWEMRQSGSQPPGSQIIWQWRITDVNGVELLTPEQSVTWLDSVHPWQVLSEDDINLHWYGAGQSFGRKLLDAATQALVTLDEKVGLVSSSPVDFYIYSNNQDFQEAILYEPGWSGGLAYSAQSIVLIGISPDNLEWGLDTIAHELTHVLEGHFTFSCLGDMPTWLVEGIATYGEGGLDSFSQSRFELAVKTNELISIRALSGGFSEDPDKANLSYSESYSLVNFLLEQYGKDKFIELLTQLRDGIAIENALREVYSFGLDGFEAAWRQDLGAPAPSEGVEPTPTVQPTHVPTIIPVSGQYVSPAEPVTEPSPIAQVAPPAEPAGEIKIPLFVVLLILIVLVLVVVAIIILVRRRKKSHA